MSFAYTLYRQKHLRHPGFKKISRSLDEMYAIAQRENRKRPFEIPGDHSFVYGDVKIQLDSDGQTYHCLAIQQPSKKKKEPVQQAILYLHDQGLLMQADYASVRQAQRMAKETGLDVWLPYYPLIIEHELADTIAMIDMTLWQMSRQYTDIRIYGSGAGASLGLWWITENNQRKNRINKVTKAVFVSPEGIWADEREKKSMCNKEKQDSFLSVDYLERVHTIIRRGAGRNIEQLLDFTGLDLRWLSAVRVYYGQDELLCAKKELVEQALAKTRAQYEIVARPGMTHVYCARDGFPEARADYKDIRIFLRS